MSTGRPSVPEGIGMKPQFSDMELELVNHKQAEFTTDSNIFKIKIKAPKPVQTTYNLFHYDSNGSETKLDTGVFTQMEDNQLVFRVAVSTKGWHKLNLFAMPDGQSGSLPCVFTYLFDVTAIKKRACDYPKLFSDWNSKCLLKKPFYLDNSDDLSKVQFKVKVPNAKRVAVKAGDEWTQLQKKGGDEWEGQVNLENYKKKNTDVNLNACTGSDETQYATLMKFKI